MATALRQIGKKIAMTSPPNILIITFDCLRPDHLNGYGYRGTHTLAFDQYIQTGTSFLTAYCQAPNTWISHASLFTGCNPYLHGVRTPTRKISSHLEIMAQTFQKAGYATFGLPAMSLLSKESGFADGFDEYMLEGLQSEEKLLAHRYYRSAQDTLEKTKQWLTQASRPFFCWIHYFGTHWVEKDLLDLPTSYQVQFSPYAQYYDGKVSFADEHFLKPLTAFLIQNDLWKDTITMLWSDHGENLQAIEHNPRQGHNWGLEEKVMQTVFILRGPGVPVGKQNTQIAQSIDVFPTLLALTGLPAPREIEGRNLFDKATADASPIVYMENLAQGFIAVRRKNHKLILSEHAPPSKRPKGRLSRRYQVLKGAVRELMPIRMRKKTMDWWKAQGEPEQVLTNLLAQGNIYLYDLALDPNETNNLAKKHPRIVDELQQIIRETQKRTPQAQSISMTTQEESAFEEQLKKLGYL